MNEQTAGPWKATLAVQDNGPNYWAVTTGQWGEPTIARVYNKENANLIAALPELLEALKTLVNEIHKYKLLDVKKRFSLCSADAQAGTAIHKATRKVTD